MEPRDLLLVLLVAVLAGMVARLASLRRQIVDVSRQMTRVVEGRARSAVTLQLGHGPLAELVAGVNGVLHHAELTAARSRRDEAQLRRMITDISHDLRTPVTAVRGYQQALADTTLTPAQRAKLAVAQRNTNDLADLVDRLFEYSQLLADERADEPTRVDLTTLVTQALLDAVEPLQRRGVRVELESAGPVIVMTDLQRLTRIVANLVRNAAQHAEGTLRVSVRSQPTEAGLRLVVLEMTNPVTGDVDVTRLFERFYTGDGSRSARTSGLGLSIVAGLAERLGGAASATRAGDQLTIRVNLPDRADGHPSS